MRLCIRCQTAFPHGGAFVTPTNPTGCGYCWALEEDSAAAARLAWMRAVDRRFEALEARLDKLEALSGPF